MGSVQIKFELLLGVTVGVGVGLVQTQPGYLTNVPVPEYGEVPPAAETVTVDEPPLAVINVFVA